MAASETISFFKVILTSALQEGKMKLPKKFAKEQGSELPETVRLCLPTGRCWSVRIERGTDNAIWLHDGLHKFIEDNSIRIEYILVFKYDGNSEFGVQIFDLTAAEVQYTYIDDSINHDNIDQTLIAETGESENGSGNCARGGVESDDSDVECLSSSRLGVLQGTDKGSRCYFTRRRKQAMEDGIISDGSMRKLGEGEGNATNEDNPAEIQYTCNDGSINCDNIVQTLIAETGESEIGSGNCARGGAESHDSAVECLGSSRVGVLQGTNKGSRCYFTRRRKQVMEGGIISDRSKRKLGEGNATNEDNYGKNTTMYKGKTRNDDTGACLADVGKERIIEPEYKSSPNFFKVTLKSSYVEKGFLRVPPDFSMLHMSNSTSFIKLIDTENNEWVVRYIYRGRRSFLSSGWRRFVQEKKLMIGDVCIFKRVQGGDEVKLRVTISRSDEKNSAMYKDTRRNDGIDVSPSDPINKPSPNFFKVTLKPCYIKKGYLYVPSDFALLHMSDSTRLIKLVDTENNEWLVRYIHRSYNKFLSAGWRCFVQAKKLMVGDVCMFEHIQGDDEVKLRVTVSRSGKQLG